MRDQIVVQDTSPLERVVVQEYSLADYTFKIAELASQGYKPSTENEGFPVSYGLVYVCHMILEKEKDNPEVNPNQLELDLEVKPRGRLTKKV